MIETERLVLRPYVRTDLEPWFATMTDPELFRFLPPAGLSREDGWNRLLRHAGHWSWFGYGNLAIGGKDDGRLLGEVGLFESRRELGAGFDGCIEVAWMLAPAAQGRGYAFEAVSAALRWLEEVHAAERTVCLIGAENQPSFRLAAKLGYRPFGSCVYKNIDHTMLERRHPGPGGGG